ncbi:hypothetical protein [Nitrosospira briensis]|uniref:hypothetical protein n=1 Tax=Nitrosospira briensis TaxID=35799 RepID=UPI001C435E66|nr:hypothetical protein [Nitrosospira briensis]
MIKSRDYRRYELDRTNMAKGTSELPSHDYRLTTIKIFGVRLRQLGEAVNAAAQGETRA